MQMHAVGSVVTTLMSCDILMLESLNNPQAKLATCQLDQLGR